MARNPVQFQKGMSLAAFQAEYGGKESCEAALRAQRWPQGFVCPKCQGRKHSYCVRRRLYQCSACRTQTSLKAGTIFHKSKVPLTTWFLAIYLLTQSKNDISALELSRQLGVKYDTAWAIKHKLMAAMQDRNKAYKLKGDVQIDDAYLGGERKGTPGRGAVGKIPFLAAVETRDGKPVYIKLRRVAAFNKEAVKSYAKEALEPGSTVLSDGLYCFESLAEAGMTHTAIKRGRASRSALQMGQHLPCQYQGRHHRNLPGHSAAARRPLSCRLRIPLQPPFRSSEHGSGAGEGRCRNRAETL